MVCRVKKSPLGCSGLLPIVENAPQDDKRVCGLLKTISDLTNGTEMSDLTRPTTDGAEDRVLRSLGRFSNHSPGNPYVIVEPDDRPPEETDRKEAPGLRTNTRVNKAHMQDQIGKLEELLQKYIL